jgi:uncharacterized protein (TIGR02996 family)
MSAPALLAAILASPDDDLPRLVYADWLDEHGDPARAEFIRTQIELAKLPDHDPRFRALEDREHELLCEHEVGWIGNGADGLSEWEWRRGFVDEITAQGSVVEAVNFDAFRHPLRVLHITTSHSPIHFFRLQRAWWATVNELSWDGPHLSIWSVASFLSRAVERHGHIMPHLRELNLVGLSGVNRELAWLTNHFQTSRLKSLSFGRTTPAESLDPYGFVGAFENAQLERLTAADAGLTSDGLRTLLTAPFAATLKHLDISDNPIAPDAYRAFQQCHPNMRLDKLDVSGTPLAGISLEPLLNAASLQRLTKLEMNGCGSARRNMEVLANSAFWTQATELRAHSGTIPASTLEPLCTSAGPPGLRLLDLADNYVRTEGVRMLCESPWAGSLTWLALSRNYLDDESCEVLAKSGRFTHLRTLHLAHNHFTEDGDPTEVITSRGVMALAEAPSLANLRLLTLSDTGITDTAVDVVVNAPFWRLFGLGIGGCDLSPAAVRILANSPRLLRFTWLDVSDNRQFGGQALRPLAESPYLSRMCELDCGGIDIDDDVRAIFRERLGPRFSH